MMIVNVKREIKKIIGMPFIAADTKIQAALNQVEVVSFDIFDTLVKRNVLNPEDIHYLVQKQFYEQTGIKIQEYQEIRVRAEKLARKKSKTEEITLEEIFSFITNIPMEQKIILKNMEEAIELENCCPNIKMQGVYKKAVEENKHIIITSDMYLDEIVIKNILHKCGYTEYEKLYLSSKYKLCKSTGNLFEIIKKDYKDLEGAILHIGDNVKSDYYIPRKKKINALLINGEENLLRYWKIKNRKIENKFLYQRIVTFLNNHINPNITATERIGYEVLGPMLLGYCKWLNYMIEKDDVKKIFFLSREGKLLQTAYNILYPQSEIPQCYLYASRQALLVPLIADADNFDEIISILKCFFHTPLLRTIRVVCGIEEMKFKKKLKEIGLEEENKIHELSQEKKNQLYFIIKELGDDDFIYQKKLVQKYLMEVDFRERVGISDIGWSGTMQKALQQYVTSNNTKIFGYYLGVRNVENDNYYSQTERNGYLFSPGENEELNLMARFTTEIFEMMFLNSNGSVQKYKIDAKVSPVLNSTEYAGKDNKLIVEIQNSGLDFLRQIRETLNIKDVPADIVMSPYAAYAIYPTLDTLKIFDDFSFLDGESRKMLPIHSLLYYLVHPIELKNDMNRSLCKIFFLKHIFKLKFPYFEILKILTMFGIESEYRKKYIKQ